LAKLREARIVAGLSLSADFMDLPWNARTVKVISGGWTWFAISSSHSQKQTLSSAFASEAGFAFPSSLSRENVFEAPEYNDCQQ
jgi:hypothetical protein